MDTKTQPTDQPASGPRAIPGSRRGQPGRPRTGDIGIFGTPKPGHSTGTATTKPQASQGDGDRTLVIHTVAPVSPRLLDLHMTAAYLGISIWKVRELENARILVRVRIPLPGAGEVRKLLFDRIELDRLVDGWKS